MNNETPNRIARGGIATLLLAFAAGLLPSLLVCLWAERTVGDMRDQFILMSAANVGNTQEDVHAQLRSLPVYRTVRPGESLRVRGYAPVPSNKVTKVAVLYRAGRYLLYVFYGPSNLVEATYIAEKT
jgi:hypothetical protein